MARINSPLQNIRIAAPCSADWNEMSGTKRVRFCSDCELNVYNLSEMSKSEAESLLLETEGRLCVRFYRRKDGSVITQNCPFGLRVVKRRVERAATSVLSALLTFCAGLGLYNLSARIEAAAFNLVSLPQVPMVETLPTTSGGEEKLYNIETVAGQVVRDSQDSNFTMGKMAVGGTYQQPVQIQRKRKKR